MLQEGQVFASIPAADYARAKAWYEEKLGLTPTMEMMGGNGLYKCGDGTAFLLYETQFAGTGKHTLAGWNVKDLDATMADMRSKGVTFEDYDMPGLKTDNGVAETEGMRSAWFKDSEDNILTVGEMPPI
jgi:predicted enzyme related to lactoylglutathione lyase